MTWLELQKLAVKLDDAAIWWLAIILLVTATVAYGVAIISAIFITLWNVWKGK